MFHRINKGQPAIWRDPSTMQIGLDGRKVILENLTIAQQQIIEALYSGVVDGQQKVLDETYKTDSGTTQALIDKLTPVLEKPESISNLHGHWQKLAFAEISRAALDYEVNPEMVMAERWQRVVHIDQIDRFGLILTKGLLASGIGKVVTHDEGRILRSDLGELGFTKESLGQSRFMVTKSQLDELILTEQLSERFLDLTYKPSKDLKISFAVTVGHLASRPSTYIRWLNRDVPHLNVLFELNQTQISPIVIPGQTPCLNCFAEYKVDEDPAWPAIASQLLDLPRTQDDSSALLTAAGLALRPIIRQLDESAGFLAIGDEDRTYRNGYRLDYATGNVYREKYDFHKLCNCITLE